MTDAEGAVWNADIVVLPKPGVNDPPGEAIRGALETLGYSAVEQVRSGRFIQVTLLAADAATAEVIVAGMCEQLLANPVIETYHVTVTPLQLSSAMRAAG